MSGGFLQYDPDVICKMIQVCGVLHNFLVELRDEGDGEEAEPDADVDAAPQQGAQPQDEEAEFQDEREKRLGEERRARVMARFIEARRSLGLPLVPR